jgi:hypothetical protein
MSTRAAHAGPPAPALAVLAGRVALTGSAPAIIGRRVRDWGGHVRILGRRCVSPFGARDMREGEAQRAHGR